MTAARTPQSRRKRAARAGNAGETRKKSQRHDRHSGRIGHPMHHRARLRRPERLRKITRDHGPAWLAIHWGSCWLSRALLPMRTSVFSCLLWRKTCRMARKTRSRWPTSIRDKQARKRHKRRRTTGCMCRSSGGKTRQEALSCCRAVGWLRAARAGSSACDDWHGTTRADRKRWQGCIVSSSPSACVTMRQLVFAATLFQSS